MKKVVFIFLLGLIASVSVVLAARTPYKSFDDLLRITHDQPKSFVLYQNFPNPFNPSTVIRFELKTKQYAKVNVYNILGKLIATLKDETMDAGVYEVKFNAGELPSGVYFYSIETRSGKMTRQMLLMK
ncbi:MAG TPA: T9SS type A sorting domain-containing protein [Rhodothermales bacterium]|nr:T9SS type A sorting domain-containing protein [Rhodothermales bacterium]HRR09941.1 T9SS type A sorting domain-containing protein [Rhodothermales bacterium]